MELLKKYLEREKQNEIYKRKSEQDKQHSKNGLSLCIQENKIS